MLRRRHGLIALLICALMALPVSASQTESEGPLAPNDAPLSLHAAGDLAPVDFKGKIEDGSELDLYILHLVEPPLSSYRGGIDGLAPTNPRMNGRKKLDLEDKASKAYLAHLKQVQDHVIESSEQLLEREVFVAYRYQYIFSGVALEVTGDEAQKLASLRSVEQVEKREWNLLDTDVGPPWIGAEGIWDGSSVPGGTGTKGEGVIVGILDTGIHIDHPSFAAEAEDGYTHTNPRPEFLGWCNPAHPKYDASIACNDKLIGVYSFPDSGDDPEDDNGHGSHTASTAAGNPIAEAVLRGPTKFITRTITGVAPRANVISYDVCAGGCPNTATIAGIDQAAADGVDALNYSISRSIQSPWINGVNKAFLGAYEAGAFIAASSGNNGVPQSTNGTGPWMTNVAASTHTRALPNSLVDLTGGDMPQADLDGAGLTAGYGPAPIVFAGNYNKADGTQDDGQCLEEFPAGTWNGEIVVCDRGQIARTAKGANVLAGGAGGYVLANTAAQGEGISADPHFLPGVHIGWAAAQQLHAWLAAGADHMATISGTVVDIQDSNADVMASFNAQGPMMTQLCCRRGTLSYGNDYADYLKPDITAPGVDVLAATMGTTVTIAPEVALLSGTSMSSPHTAGAGALMAGVQPMWSPSAIQSALMLTADVETNRKTDGTTPSDPFDLGSGRVNLAAAARAGFVLDEDAQAMKDADPAMGGDVKTLNLASLMDAHCMKNCGWTRTLTSVSAAAVDWTVSVQPIYEATELPAGLNITVNPSSFTLSPGGTQEIEVTADVSAVDFDAFVFAQLVFEPSELTVPQAHMPIVIRPLRTILPHSIIISTDQVAGSHTEPGLRVIDVSAMQIAEYGLAKGQYTFDTVEPDPTNGSPYDVVTGTRVIWLDVPAEAKRIVAEITASSANDLDLFVGRDANGDGMPQPGEQACVSGSPTAVELCDLLDPAEGRYWVLIQNWEGSGNQPEDDFTVSTGVVTGEAVGNMTVVGPAEVVDAEPFSIDVNWDIPTLQPADIWYGLAWFGSSAGRQQDLGVVLIDLLAKGEIPPTPTPAVTDTPEPTPEPTDPPPPTDVPPTAVPPTPMPTATAELPDACVCQSVRNSVPAAVVNAAVNSPNSIGGYNQPANPALPPGPFNPPRTCLSLINPSLAFHPLFNTLVYRAGCP